MGGRKHQPMTDPDLLFTTVHRRHQTFRPQSLKKPLAMRDSRNVTVRELRVTSVMVTSAGPTAGLHTSSSCFSDAATSSVLLAELHSCLVSCAEREKGEGLHL